VDNQKFVIFYLNSDTNKFNSYQIIDNKTEEELNSAIGSYNIKNARGDIAKMITDQVIVDAILQKESKQSIRSIAKEFQDSIEEIQDSIRYLEHRIEEVKELAKE
jgi:hypothetical protein